MNRHQKAALLRAHKLDAESRDLLRNLPEGDEERRDAIAHAAFQADMSLTLRETIGHIDPFAHSYRRLRAIWPGATRQTLSLLSHDRSRKVRNAAAAEVARRERDAIVPRSPDAEFVHRDPLDFVTG